MNFNNFVHPVSHEHFHIHICSIEVELMLVDVSLYFLENLSDFSLDNNFVVDVWGGVIYLLVHEKIFYYSELDRIQDNIQSDEQLKCIFQVIGHALNYDENSRQAQIEELTNCGIVSANKNTFFEVVEPREG